VIAVAAGCAQPVRPTLLAADLYAQVSALRATGRVVVDGDPRPIEVRTTQYLVTPDGARVFPVAAAIANCKGGEPDEDIGCTLVLLRAHRFTVRDTPPR